MVSLEIGGMKIALDTWYIHKYLLISFWSVVILILCDMVTDFCILICYDVTRYNWVSPTIRAIRDGFKVSSL